MSNFNKLNILNIDEKNSHINVGGMAAETEYNFRNLNIPFITDIREMMPIGLDVGFSATKIFSMFGYHKYPSVVRKIRKRDLDNIKYSDDCYILYKTSDRDIWLVGHAVINRTFDQLTNEDTLYTENRLNSEENLVLNRVGIALALMKDDFSFVKNPAIRLCVGLPEKQVDSHADSYIDLLMGHHEFEIKIGSRDWQKIKVDVEEENISVLSQPFGTLLSLASDRKGKIINENLLKKDRTLIYDGGFGTIDTFLIENGNIVNSTTDPTLAMKDIFNEARDTIAEKTDIMLQLHQFNYYLSKDQGERFIWYNGNQKYDLDPDIKLSTINFAEDNIKMLNQQYRGFNNVDSIIVTGGTGKVFFPFFQLNIPKNIQLAEVKDSTDKNEDFDCVYANSVGFFNYIIINYRDEIGYIEEAKEVKGLESLKDEEVAATCESEEITE
ncbi:ParM/StbA family protein [Alkaliphilus sp. B6464]|uniref:ParM/StbA family protein n=1 Tax=Alkaliphilus sp. B6464 TaxID=2731219 RepID=UPI001BA7B7C8|nr:ParM/StbA family protein [Alkaliphilus sp. B6464]QUH22083.1 ParM/StbA family protein [Alkaliphilus sp. B6464]